MNQDHFDCMEFFLENTFGAVNVQFIEEPLFGRAYSLYAGRTIGDDEHLIVVTSGLRHETWVDAKGVKRMQIKPASTVPGVGPMSEQPRVTLRNELGQRIDWYGRPVTKKSVSAHAPLSSFTY